MIRLSVFLLLLSVVLSMIGGWCDITNKRFLGMSREHYWTDATYLAVLASSVHFILKM